MYFRLKIWVELLWDQFHSISMSYLILISIYLSFQVLHYRIQVRCVFFYMTTRLQVFQLFTSSLYRISHGHFEKTEDSTVLRNVGLPLAHTAIALTSIQRGLGKLLVNKVGWLLTLHVDVVCFFLCFVLLFFFGGAGWLACMIGCANVDMAERMTPEKCNCYQSLCLVLKSLGFSWFATPNIGLHHYGKYAGDSAASHHWGSLGRGQTFLEGDWCRLATKQKLRKIRWLLPQWWVVWNVQSLESASWVLFFRQTQDNKLNNDDVHNSKLSDGTFFHQKKNHLPKNWFLSIQFETGSTASTSTKNNKLCFEVSASI